MRVAIIGAGYVGLVSAACLSEFGDKVVCVDADKDKIAKLRDGHMPIFEPGLEALVATNVDAGRLTFSTNLVQSMVGVDAVFIAVGTPSRRGDGNADVSYVYAAAEEIAVALRDNTVVVTKSTVPVGTGREVKKIIQSQRPDLVVDVAANPEFLREGSAINDFMRPDRVVVGTDSEQADQVLRTLYRPLFLNETPILFTTLETAELIKYASNAFLATKVAFINEMSDLCERSGGDIQVLARALGLDGRIGNKFLHPGPGFGGSCFPKDTRALAGIARDIGAPSQIVEAVVSSNNARKKAMVGKIIEACEGPIKGKVVAVLGLTFKPNTDDVREAPSLEIIPALQESGAIIQAFDPEGMKEAQRYLNDVVWCASSYETMKNADILTILTEWNEFRALDLVRVKKLMNEPLIVDFRNVYEPKEMEAAGFRYFSLGRASIVASAERI